jgi:hypothetical protein
VDSPRLLIHLASRLAPITFDTDVMGSELSNIVPSVFTPVLAKHTKHLSLVDILSVGVDRMQRNFEPMRKQVEAWRARQLFDEAAKLIVYRALIEGELEVPKHPARVVHSRYFDPQYKEVAPRTLWSLSNAFSHSAVSGNGQAWGISRRRSHGVSTS